MQSPIGGPRFWRRLVSRWLHPARRMQREWNERAQTDPQGYIGRGYAGSDAQFWASGAPDLDGLILDGLELDRRATVLEIGCGVGRLLRPLATRAHRVIGVDIAPAMIEQGRTLLADLPRVSLHVTHGRLDAVGEASLDLVYSFAVFQHIPSKRAIAQYVSEAARTLRAGGVFKFQVDGRRRPFWRGTDTWLGVWYTPEEIRRVLADRGFTVADAWGAETQYYWITAVRQSAAGRPATDLVRVRSNTWNRTALAALLTRLGHDAAAALPEITADGRPLRDFVRHFLDEHRHHSPEAFVTAAFHVLFNRAPDVDGLAFYTAELRRGGSRAYLLDCLLASAELRRALRE
jgi:SAM-dependent methyltransferase